MLNLAIISLVLGVGSSTARGADLAVLPLRTSTMQPSTRDALTSVLASVVQKAAPYSVISAADVDAMLKMEAAKDLVGCDSVVCARDLAGALGVRYILVTTGDILGRQAFFTTTLIDSRAGVVERRETEVVDDDPARYLDAVRAVIAATFAAAPVMPPASAGSPSARWRPGVVSRMALSPSIDPDNSGQHDWASGALVAAQVSLPHLGFLEARVRLGMAYDGRLWSFDRQIAGVIGVGEQGTWSPIATGSLVLLGAIDADFFAGSNPHADTVATMGVRYRGLELRLGGGVRVLGDGVAGAGAPTPHVIPIFATEVGARL